LLQLHIIRKIFQTSQFKEVKMGDFKSQLNILSQSLKTGESPVYTTDNRWDGERHIFTSNVQYMGRIAQGDEPSHTKLEAEQKAAKAWLKRARWIRISTLTFSPPILFPETQELILTTLPNAVFPANVQVLMFPKEVTLGEILITGEQAMALYASFLLPQLHNIKTIKVRSADPSNSLAREIVKSFFRK